MVNSEEEPTKRTLILLFIIVLTRSPSFYLLAEALCVRYLYPEGALSQMPPAGQSPSPVWCALPLAWKE